MRRICILLIAVCAAGCANTRTTSTTPQRNAPSDLSEREAQLIYSRAYEAILWASPALAIIAMDEAAERDLGAVNADIIYSAKPMDHQLGADHLQQPITLLERGVLGLGRDDGNPAGVRE